MLWLPGRRLHRGLKLPEIGELDLAAVESEFVVQDNIHRGATRQLGFRSAREKNGGEACDRTYASADPGPFALSRNGADARSGGGSLDDRAHILPLVAATSNFAFGVHGFLAAGICAARGGFQIHGVTGRQDQRVQAHAEFAAALHAARTFGFDEFAAKIRADRDDNAVADRDGKRSLQINRIAGLGTARGNPVLEDDADARAGGNDDLLARTGARRCRFRKDGRGRGLRSRRLLRRQPTGGRNSDQKTSGAYRGEVSPGHGGSLLSETAMRIFEVKMPRSGGGVKATGQRSESGNRRKQRRGLPCSADLWSPFSVLFPGG